MWAENFLYIQALCFVLKNNQVSATENQSLAVWPPEINLAFLTYAYDPNIYVLVAKMAVQRLKNDSVVPNNVKFKFVIFHLNTTQLFRIFQCQNKALLTIVCFLQLGQADRFPYNLVNVS